MKTKITAAILAFALILSAFAGCGKENESEYDAQTYETLAELVRATGARFRSMEKYDMSSVKPSTLDWQSGYEIRDESFKEIETGGEISYGSYCFSVINHGSDCCGQFLAAYVPEGGINNDDVIKSCQTELEAYIGSLLEENGCGMPGEYEARRYVYPEIEYMLCCVSDNKELVDDIFKAFRSLVTGTYFSEDGSFLYSNIRYDAAEEDYEEDEDEDYEHDIDGNLRWYLTNSRENLHFDSEESFSTLDINELSENGDPELIDAIKSCRYMDTQSSIEAVFGLDKLESVEEIDIFALDDSHFNADKMPTSVSVTGPIDVAEYGSKLTVLSDRSENYYDKKIEYKAEGKAIYGDNKTVLAYVAKDVESFTIPSSVKSILNYAFKNCRKLRSITLPDSIEDGVPNFTNCVSLTEITLPDSVSRIYNDFEGCTSLKKINASGLTCTNIYALYEYDNDGNRTEKYEIDNPYEDLPFFKDESNWENGVFYIDTCAVFADPGVEDVKGTLTLRPDTTSVCADAFILSNASEIVIPDSVKRLGNNSLTAPKAKKISIGSGVGSLGEEDYVNRDYEYENDLCFSSPEIYSSALTEITVSEANKNLRSVDGVLYSKDMTRLMVYPAAKSGDVCRVPDTVKTIYEHAFYGNPYLKTIVLGSGLWDLKCTFMNLKNLSDIVIPETVTSLDFYLEGVNLDRLFVPKSVTYYGVTCSYRCIEEGKLPVRQIDYEGSRENWERVKTSYGYNGGVMLVPDTEGLTFNFGASRPDSEAKAMQPSVTEKIKSIFRKKK